MKCLKVHALVLGCCTPQLKTKAEEMLIIRKVVAKVCMCDGMPGLHNFSSGCNTKEGFVAFVPNKNELAVQHNCPHTEEVFEGVCSDCGKIVNEMEAAKWAK